MKISIVVVVACVLLVTGCAHPAPPRAIAVPTAAAVRVPLVAAQTSNRRAAQIARQAESRGIAAGSADARQLVLATAATGSQLAVALDQVDRLNTQLHAAQVQADKQTATLAWYMDKYREAVRSLWWYRLRFWGPLAAAIAAVVIFVFVRFTAWGARTLGPYVVATEHLAVKGAAVAALV